MRTGLYPGTFDPVTHGHVDIIRRAVKLVDRLVIGAKGRARVADSVETTLKWGNGLMHVLRRGPTEAVTAGWSEQMLSNQNACTDVDRGHHRHQLGSDLTDSADTAENDRRNQG